VEPHARSRRLHRANSPVRLLVPPVLALELDEADPREFAEDVQTLLNPEGLFFGFLARIDQIVLDEQDELGWMSFQGIIDRAPHADVRLVKYGVGKEFRAVGNSPHLITRTIIHKKWCTEGNFVRGDWSKAFHQSCKLLGALAAQDDDAQQM